eukprot:UN00773
MSRLRFDYADYTYMMMRCAAGTQTEEDQCPSRIDHAAKLAEFNKKMGFVPPSTIKQQQPTQQPEISQQEKPVVVPQQQSVVQQEVPKRGKIQKIDLKALAAKSNKFKNNQ